MEITGIFSFNEIAAFVAEDKLDRAYKVFEDKRVIIERGVNEFLKGVCCVEYKSMYLYGNDLHISIDATKLEIEARVLVMHIYAGEKLLANLTFGFDKNVYFTKHYPLINKVVIMLDYVV